MRSRTIVARSSWIVAIAIAGFVAYAWRGEIAPVDPPPPQSFAAASIERGAQLAALGDCATCHTREGGEAFAGGRPISTPFGTVYSTNITPDPISGIGHWSRAAFVRAMREGVNRGGSHLYPAFPYEHFTLVTDEDDAALYAFIMTRQPVQSRTPDNDLPFPLNVRFLMAGWKLLFFKQGPYPHEASHDGQWNRGAYLANGIGHCGACHTPRNSLGAEIAARRFDGGEAAGWHAHAINASSRAREPWNAASLHAYLRNGWHEQHGAAHGPMAPVTESLSGVPDADVRAISSYVASLYGAANAKHEPASAPPMPENDTGAYIYSTTCAGCHNGARPLPFGGVELALSSDVSGESATNLINIVLDGLQAREGTRDPIMPGYSSALTDGQLESLIAYIRSNFSSGAPWTGVEPAVREARGRSRD
jgi:mono/diheme cytochrome c family protein